jgi:hypothetical protein
MYSDQIVQSREFVKDWLLCGPFPGVSRDTLVMAATDTSSGSMNFDYLESIGGEEHAIPAIGTQVELAEFKTVRRWFFHQSATAELNLNTILGDQPFQVVYAFFRVKCSQGRTAHLVVTGTAGLKIFLNGTVVAAVSAVTALTATPKPDLVAEDSVAIPITFKPGKNNLLFKLEQNASDFRCQVHFRE